MGLQIRNGHYKGGKMKTVLRVMLLVLLVGLFASSVKNTVASPVGEFVGMFRFGEMTCTETPQCGPSERKALTLCPESDAALRERPGFVTDVVTDGDNVRCEQGVCASDNYRFRSCKEAGVW